MPRIRLHTNRKWKRTASNFYPLFCSGLTIYNQFRFVVVKNTMQSPQQPF